MDRYLKNSLTILGSLAAFIIIWSLFLKPPVWNWVDSLPVPLFFFFSFLMMYGVPVTLFYMASKDVMWTSYFILTLFIFMPLDIGESLFQLTWSKMFGDSASNLGDFVFPLISLLILWAVLSNRDFSQILKRGGE